MALTTLGGCDAGPATPPSSATDVTVAGAELRLSPVPGRPASGYFHLRGPAAARLVSVATPAAQRIELHGNMDMGGMAGMTSMVPLTPDQLRLANGELAFAPGANHAMVFGVAATVRPGTKVPMTFTFDGAPPVTVQADVRSITGE